MDSYLVRLAPDGPLILTVHGTPNTPRKRKILRKITNLSGPGSSIKKEADSERYTKRKQCTGIIVGMNAWIPGSSGLVFQAGQLHK